MKFPSQFSSCAWRGAVAAATAGLMLCGFLAAAPAAQAGSILTRFSSTPAATQAEEAIDDAAGVVSACMSGLEFEGIDVSVNEMDQVEVCVSGGKVCVVQRGEGAMPLVADEAEETAESADADVAQDAAAEEPRFDLGELDRAGLGAVRANALFALIEGLEVADGSCVVEPGADPAEAEPADPADEPSVAAVTELVWCVAAPDDRLLAAYVLKTPAESAAPEPTDAAAEPAPTHLETFLASDPASDPAEGAEYALQTAALLDCTGWWVSHPEFEVSRIMNDWAHYRFYGEVPALPDGRLVDDPTFSTWVVDTPASETSTWVVDQPSKQDYRWVVDQAGWDESVWVDTSGWQYGQNYFCSPCGTDFGTNYSSAYAHYEYWLSIAGYYIFETNEGRWVCAFCDADFGTSPVADEYCSDYVYTHHINPHYPSSYDTSIWVDGGYWDSVHHDEVGHWEPYMTQEQGHWDTVMVEEVGHWEANELGEVAKS